MWEAAAAASPGSASKCRRKRGRGRRTTSRAGPTRSRSRCRTKEQPTARASGDVRPCPPAGSVMLASALESQRLLRRMRAWQGTMMRTVPLVETPQCPDSTVRALDALLRRWASRGRRADRGRRRGAGIAERSRRGGEVAARASRARESRAAAPGGWIVACPRWSPTSTMRSTRPRRTHSSFRSAWRRPTASGTPFSGRSGLGELLGPSYRSAVAHLVCGAPWLLAARGCR